MSADAFIDTNVFEDLQHGQQVAGLTIVDPFRVSDS